MKMQDKLFAPTPKKIQKLLLGLKSFIGTVSVLAIVQEKPYLSAAFLISGALIDFIVNYAFTDTNPE